MPRYIDADELLTDKNQHYDWLSDEHYVRVRTIELMPIADVVEVVRCRDCVHYKQWYRDRGLCDLWARDGISVFNDGFCNYGERRQPDDPR